MKTYNDINDFILEAFPLEVEKITTRKKSAIERFVEDADEDFNKQLDAIIKGETEKAE